jgi:hypothetical protein
MPKFSLKREKDFTYEIQITFHYYSLERLNRRC